MNAATGLYILDYSPGLGRWMENDSIGNTVRLDSSPFERQLQFLLAPGR